MSTIFDLIGIGVGPSNLSVNALSYHTKIKSCFLERKKNFIWHEGMLMPDANLQVSHLKDLVTLVDPTNPFSFLAFLANQKKLYRHINAQFLQIRRKEFNNYYKWVCSRMDNLSFNDEVINIKESKEGFLIESTKKSYYAKNIVLGTGLSPSLPSFARPFLGNRVYHSSNFIEYKDGLKGKRIAIIGGGQSGAEVVNQLLGYEDMHNSVHWVTARYNFLPLDDSSFTNELYTPNYCEYFYSLNENHKSKLLKEQKLTSDGISESLLRTIYQKTYELEIIEERKKQLHLYANSKCIGMTKKGDAWNLNCFSYDHNLKFNLDLDAVIFATGYEYSIPSFMDNIRGDFRDGNNLIALNKDFSASHNGNPYHKIFIQNGARNIWGVPNHNLSLNAWRAAKIINSLVGEQHYDLNDELSVFDWVQSS